MGTITEGQTATYVAFEGQRWIASGTFPEVVRATKRVVDAGPQGPVLIFVGDTSELVEIDFRGTEAEVAARLGITSGGTDDSGLKRGPGRPRLGVVAREVTLLPRHWEWLDEQPGGASVALRKLVEASKRSNVTQDRVRHAQEAVHRFMWAMAGDLPGFEEASRAFYAGQSERFTALVQDWPAGIRDHLLRLVAKVRAAADITA